MKVLIVHNDYQQAGGELVAVEAQIALLTQKNHQVIAYRRNSAEIEEYGFQEKVGLFPNTIFSRRAYQEISDLVEKERPDVAHIHNVFPLLSPSVYQALKEKDVPVVQTVHNFRFLCPNALFFTHGQICERCKFGNTLHAVRYKCYRQSYPLSMLYATSIGWHRWRGTFQAIDRFIALTDFTAHKLIESGLVTPNQVVSLGNFLPDPLPSPGSFQQRQPYLVFLGRLSEEKGIETLIQAMAGVNSLRLKILGDGPLLEKLQSLVRNQGLEQIEFMGRVVGEQKWDLLRNAFAMVLPSVCYENFPLTALESFAVGTPVIASNIGSLPYIVRDGVNGLLFQPGDSESLREKILWSAENPTTMRSLGERGWQEIKNSYSAEAHYAALMQIYQKVIH